MASKRPSEAVGAQCDAKRVKGAGADLVLQRRALKPADIVAGGVWYGVGPAGQPRESAPSQVELEQGVAACLAAGIREFDTAPLYGHGSSEDRLGRALQSCQQKGVRVITKVGRLVREPDGETPAGPGWDAPGRAPLESRVLVNDYSAAGVRRSFRESLARMGFSKVSCLRIHDPNDNATSDPSIDEVATCVADGGGACAALRELRANGEIEQISLGMNCNREAHQGVPEEINRLISLAAPGTFDSALLAGGWNLLSQAGLPCLMECERKGIAVSIAGIYCSGLLVGGMNYAYLAAPLDKTEKRERWRALAEKHGVSLPAVAIAFAALPRCVTHLVIGMPTESEVKQNLGWAQESNTVPLGIWAEAREQGLLAAEVPLPTE